MRRILSRKLLYLTRIWVFENGLMLKKYKRQVALRYLVNIAKRMRPHSDSTKQFLNIIDEIDSELGLRKLPLEDLLSNIKRADSDEVDGIWPDVFEILCDEEKRARRAKSDIVSERVEVLAERMHLSDAEVALLECLVYYETDPAIEFIVDELSGVTEASSRRRVVFSVFSNNLADMLGISKSKLRKCFANDSPLIQSGLIEIDEDGDFTLLNRMSRLAYETQNDVSEIDTLLFDSSPKSELEWSDFDHVADGRDHVESLVSGALEKKKKGVNILIYGPPGTGKTQFCRLLASKLAVTLYEVGESENNRNGGRYGSHRNSWHQELRLAQRVLGDSQSAILLFDEMEDALKLSQSPGLGLFGLASGQSHTPMGSTAVMHRLLEDTRVPTLWTTNVARSTSKALLRRMTYAFELRQPSPRIRARIWQRHLSSHGIPCAEGDAEALAREFNVPPGLTGSATAAAKLVKDGDISTVRKGVASLSRVMYGPQPPKKDEATFEPALINANSDPVQLADRLTALGSKRFSLCLQGPPGTGKSAYVRYVANRLGFEVEQKRASDLLSMWVGETEQLIASAFAEARDFEHFLVFDEADSLLSDRRNAHRNWEVSQVNEMLTWMENHPFPFACTTNYGENLDPATLRRFDFKLALDYLTPEQIEIAFKVFFDMDPTPETRRLTNLTPADFAVVKRRAQILHYLDDVSAISNMLREESNAKPTSAKPIGFAQMDT